MDKCVRAVKSKPKGLRHLKIDPVLKLDGTVYKQAESMMAYTVNLKHVLITTFCSLINIFKNINQYFKNMKNIFSSIHYEQ